MWTMKTYEQINDRIESGKAVVLTADEIMGYVDKKGLEAVAKDAALADAAATQAANLVKKQEDVESALNQINGIKGKNINKRNINIILLEVEERRWVVVYSNSNCNISSNISSKMCIF